MVDDDLQNILGFESGNEEVDFREKILSDPDKSEQVFATLKNFFSGLSPSDQYYEWTQYFIWYTLLVWRRLSSHPKEVIIDVACKLQIPTAILLDFDIIKDLMWYLGSFTSEGLDRQSLYQKIKEAIVDSPAIVGPWKGNDVSLADLIKEMVLIDSRGGDSIAEAEFENKLKQMLFYKAEDYKDYFTENTDEALRRFIEVISFFVTVDSKEIDGIVNNLINPVIAPTESEEINEEKIEPKETFVPEVSIIEPELPEIKTMVEAKFAKDADGQFVDTEGVLGMLDELATKYHDDKIRELYYFNEADGLFHWSE